MWWPKAAVLYGDGTPSAENGSATHPDIVREDTSAVGVATVLKESAADNPTAAGVVAEAGAENV